MSVRQRAAQCLGKLPVDHPYIRAAAKPSTSRWSGDHSRWPADDPESNKLRHNNLSAAPAAPPERTFRSHDAVKAWLDSSPTSVLLELRELDDQFSFPSSTASLDSSPARSGPLNCTAKHDNLHVKGGQPANHVKRAISPPRCPATSTTLADVSRVDRTYHGGSFLMLAIPRNQRSPLTRSQDFTTARVAGRGERHRSASPPAVQQPVKAYKDKHLQERTEEGYSSPGSDFSLSAEWQSMLAAGTAAGMNTHELVQHQATTQHENGDDPTNVDSNNPAGSFMPGAWDTAGINGLERDAHTVVPAAASAVSESTPGLDNEMANTKVGDGGDGPAHSQAGGARLHHDENAPSSTARANPEQAPTQTVASMPAAWEQAQCPEPSNRSEREEATIESRDGAKASHEVKQSELKVEVKRARFLERMQHEIAAAHRKAEERKAIAEVKRAEKVAKAAAAADAERIRRTGKTLFSSRLVEDEDLFHELFPLEVNLEDADFFRGRPRLTSSQVCGGSSHVQVRLHEEHLPNSLR